MDNLIHQPHYYSTAGVIKILELTILFGFVVDVVEVVVVVVVTDGVDTCVIWLFVKSVKGPKLIPFV